MPIFALLMIFAFPSKPYKNSNKVATAGPMKALWEALDIRDLLGACVRGPMRLIREQEREIRMGGNERVKMDGMQALVGDSDEFEEDTAYRPSFGGRQNRNDVAV